MREVCPVRRRGQVVVQAGQAYLQQVDEHADEPYVEVDPAVAFCSSGALAPISAAASAAISISPPLTAHGHCNRAIDVVGGRIQRDLRS